MIVHQMREEAVSHYERRIKALREDETINAFDRQQMIVLLKRAIKAEESSLRIAEKEWG